MSTILSNVKLFIDGRATRLLKPFVSTSSGNEYLGTTKAARFGVNSVPVAPEVIPNGEKHVFAIGVDAEHAIPVTLSAYAPDKNGKVKFGGTIDIEVNGVPKKATVVVTTSPEPRIKASVTAPGRGGAGKPRTADEVFA